MKFEDTCTPRVKMWGRAVTCHLEDAHPCVLDDNIVGELPTIEQNYLKNTDTFVYYRIYNHKNIKIVVGNWEDEIEFDTFEEFRAFSKENLKALCENLADGSLDYEDFINLIS